MESEPVRLVIWDLDETLWRGTLSEGGITEYIAENHSIVVELARRGILSSICSKNDFGSVERVLTGRGLWDYFVFPSIDWTAKGPRIRTLVENAQLRPATCLFVDDNPNNLAEATAAVPNLQIASELFIPLILDDPRFTGQSDPNLLRLSRYKLLERRQKAANVAATDGRNEEFLRSCKIRVTFEYNIEPNFDRVIELINRTNQLNFTKLRLPEDNAAEALRASLNRDDVKAGLISITDIYGDHGYTGFFLVSGVKDRPRLEHFCFSCRILGMGVESFIYKCLGCPELIYKGEVLSDPINDPQVDWIAVSKDASPGAINLGYDGGVYLVGGCDVHAVSHYLRKLNGSATVQANVHRGSFFYRHDGSMFLAQKLSGLTESHREALFRLGFRPEDLLVPWNAEHRQKSIVVLNFYGDVAAPFYRHKETGLLASLGSSIVRKNLFDWDAEDWLSLGRLADRDLLESVTDEVKSSWEFFSGGLPTSAVEATIASVLDRIPRRWQIILIMPSLVGNRKGSFCDILEAKSYRQGCEAAARKYDNVSCVAVENFVQTPHDIEGERAAHFSRMVYRRLSDHILDLAAKVDGEGIVYFPSRAPADCA